LEKKKMEGRVFAQKKGNTKIDAYFAGTCHIFSASYGRE